MRGNLIAMRIPSSITRKLRLRNNAYVQGNSEEIHSLTPNERKRQMHEYLKNVNRLTPVLHSESPVKVKQLSPKSFTLITHKDLQKQSLHRLISNSNQKEISQRKNTNEKKSKSSVKIKNTSLEGHRANPSIRGKTSFGKYKEAVELSNSVESIDLRPENSYLRVIGSPASKKKMFGSMKTLNDFKYLTASSKNTTPKRITSVFASSKFAGYLPNIYSINKVF